ncbi:MAG: hypothetical protein A2X13_14995 [Bacteroidetes bacterium GWC2_33_15]|nr:MAG: hypothetical protein A2X10_07060 [Bacteroidetes bacterium GWA2_33_15]OFX50176.1 MAG: hypothetical protein A2X13_14995 [Bacteroidetes bacterium GWC2_33_15]OFX65328.1 MAG: hypothetical protein A2X15_04570 [Bacteroidetes bacterium GWB2_32_14]OFX70555.1 MAG: hypothetical protein A2X14_04625 [Bacteroidetes bacterium GWD2_33_33]HAN19571.1 GTP-binding protein [Bacteroidales bacterium]
MNNNNSIQSLNKTISYWGKGLNVFPEELFESTNIEYLFLNSNNITEIPPSINRLQNLKVLDLGNNQIKSLPVELFELEKLETIYLSNNFIETIPKNIENLKRLKFLYLDNNLIEELPSEFGRLKSLEHLYICNNKLNSLPLNFGNLTNIKTLFILNNNIKLLPTELGNAKGLSFILYEGNNISNIPLEIFSKGSKAIITYLKELSTDEKVQLFEAKLLTVGEGAVGKTCLLKKLKDFEYKIDENQVSTEGIDIDSMTLISNNSTEIKLNLWDFGGQEIYHSTHQFFLTRRSIYIFVWEARRDDLNVQFDYWLNVISLLGKDSPILIVCNKSDERYKNIDEATLKTTFKNIKGFHKVSAKTGEGVKELIKAITNEIEKLDHIGDYLPKKWIDIRKYLEKENYNYLSISHYIQICEKNGLNKSSALFLSEYYHDLGVFLHFKEHDILKDLIFVNPDWATEAVYKLIDTKFIQENYGIFSSADLSKVWQEYKEEHYKYFIELMKKFEIIFGIGDNKYVVPELLSVNSPFSKSSFNGYKRFVIEYPFMPSGIVTRLMVKLQHLVNTRKIWKDGFELQKTVTEKIPNQKYGEEKYRVIEETKGIVISQPFERKITIYLNGDNVNHLLNIIIHEIDKIHISLNNPTNDLKIPCICKECSKSSNPSLFSYSQIINFQKKGKGVITCNISAIEVDIPKLLGLYSKNSIQFNSETQNITIINNETNYNL